MKQIRRKPAFVICVSNRGYRASLVVRRVYRCLPDRDAAKHGLLRIVDETGEDYLYPERMFAAVELPRAVEKRFAATG